jgi:HEAT repeat protein/cytochrome c5
VHPFIWSVLTPDFDFGWDGRMFAALYDQLGDSRGLAVFEHSASRADPRVAELARAALSKMSTRSLDELVGWLAFPDQRLRLRAQFELAQRRAIEPLVALARDEQADLVARLHAIWALGQIGDEGMRALAAGGSGLESASDELRAQLARAAGNSRAVDWLPWLRSRLEDPSLRVRFFAAEAVGKLADRESIAPLVALLRENADRDVFLRHAAVYALYRLGAADSIDAWRSDESRSVRLAMLLVLRHAGDPRVAGFLADADPLLVVEAARAIYDGPIEGAMPALAALVDRPDGLEPAKEEDRQVGQALHRRVIGANVRLRTRDGAAALARYAADERQLGSLRALALEQLAAYAEPATRDLTMGFHRPLPPIDRAVVAAVLEAEGRALVESSLGARALEVAGLYGVSPLGDAELIARASAKDADERARVAALTALRSRAVGLEARGAAEAALVDSSPAIRRAGRELLEAIDPEAGLARYLESVGAEGDPGERQHAWRRLGAIDDPRAREAIGQGLARWAAGELDPVVALDVIEAGIASGEGALVARARALLEPSPEAPVESRRWALAGGDPVAGRTVFQTVGDCQRCHGDPAAGADEAGHGGRIGPALTGVAARGPRFALESVLVPDAQIADGFPSPSGMPPVGLVLEPRALRDLVAHLSTLE